MIEWSQKILENSIVLYRCSVCAERSGTDIGLDVDLPIPLQHTALSFDGGYSSEPNKHWSSEDRARWQTVIKGTVVCTV